MDKLNTNVIVGTASEKEWAQAQIVGGDGDSKWFVVVGLERPNDSTLVDVAAIGSEVLMEIEGNIKNTSWGDNTKGLIEEIIGGLDSGMKMGVVVVGIADEEVWIYARGGVGVYLTRGGRLAKLGDGVGRIKSDDVLLLATDKMIEGIGLGKIKELMIKGGEVGEELAPLVHQNENTGGIAGVVIQEEKQLAKAHWWDKLLVHKEIPQILIKREQNRKISLWVGGVLFILLIVMIGVGMVRKIRLVAEGEYIEMEQSVRGEIEEARRVGDADSGKAHTLLINAQEKINLYLTKEKLREEHKKKAIELVAEVELVEEQIFKKNSVELQTVVELGVLAEGLTSKRMRSDNKGSLIWLNKQSAELIAMNLIDRSKIVIDDDQQVDWVGIAANEKNVWILDERGVWEASWKNRELIRSIEADEFWKKPTLIETFAGNVYVFDKEQSEIWKYPAVDEGKYGSRRRWLAAGITPDLSKVVDMKVGGDIWLLTETGKLLRYRRGAPVSFVMEGYPYLNEEKLLSNPGAIFVTENTIYILEKGASRVIAVSQEGKFEAQFVNEEFAKADDLVVVDDKAYVLIEDVVREFGL